MSKPDDIAQDIWEAASNALEQEGWEIINGSAWHAPGDIEVSNMEIGPIARAILNERNNAAKIAETYDGSGLYVGGSTGSARQTMLDISQAIRNGRIT